MAKGGLQLFIQKIIQNFTYNNARKSFRIFIIVNLLLPHPVICEWYNVIYLCVFFTCALGLNQPKEGGFNCILKQGN